MAQKFKFATMLLAVVIFLGSLPLSARCTPAQKDDGRPHCAPDCPMMVHAPGDKSDEQLTATAALTASNCCNVSSARPQSVAQIQTPSGGSAIIVPDEAGTSVQFVAGYGELTPFAAVNESHHSSGTVLRI